MCPIFYSFVFSSLLRIQIKCNAEQMILSTSVAEIWGVQNIFLFLVGSVKENN